MTLQLPFKTGITPRYLASNFPSKLAGLPPESLQLPFKTGRGGWNLTSNFPSKLAGLVVYAPPTSLQNWLHGRRAVLQLPFKTGLTLYISTSNFPSKLASCIFLTLQLPFKTGRSQLSFPPTSLQIWPGYPLRSSNFPSNLAIAELSVYSKTLFIY